MTPLECLRHENFSGYIRFKENVNTFSLIPVKSLESIINLDDTPLTQQQIVNLFQNHCSCFREKFSRWYEFVNQVVLKSSELQEFDQNELQLITKTNQQVFIKSICDTQQFKNEFVFEGRTIDNTVSSLSTLSQNLFPALINLEDRCLDTTTSQTNDLNADLVLETRRLRQLLGVANLSLVDNRINPNVLFNLPNVENVPNPPQIGNEKGCYVVPMFEEASMHQHENLLQFLQFTDEMLNQLPFTSETLNYTSLPPIPVLEEFNARTLENIERRENVFFTEHNCDAVAVVRSASEGLVHVFPVIPVLNSPQNLLSFNLCQQNAAHVLESHVHFLQFFKSCDPGIHCERLESEKLEQIFHELNILNRTILLNTLDLTHTLYLHQLKSGLDAVCPSTIVFNTLIEYSKMFNPNFVINDNVIQNLNLSLPEHQQIFNKLFFQVINLETRLNEPFQRNM